MTKPEELIIKPEFSNVYSWELVPVANSLVLTIQYPEGFDPKKVTAKLNDDKTAISVRYPEQPPIVEGKLFDKIKDMNMKIKEEEKEIVLTFTKFDEKAVSVLCDDIHPETHQLDPLSSFIIFHFRSQSKDEKIAGGCFSYLEYGLNAFFVPSMLVAANLFRQIPGLQERSVELMVIAADRYHSKEAAFQMGLFFINNPNNKDSCLRYMQMAAEDEELLIAKIILAVMYSPISDMISAKKDGKLAAKLFEEVLVKEENPLALHEYAMLLYNGIGVDKDEARAKEMNDRANSLDKEQNTPLEKRDESYVPKPPQPCCGCCCGHDHGHEHQHDVCGCGHEHGHCECAHDHGHCGCGHEHNHEHHDDHEKCHCDKCECGHDDHEKCHCEGKCDGNGGCGGNCQCKH